MNAGIDFAELTIDGQFNFLISTKASGLELSEMVNCLSNRLKLLNLELTASALDETSV